jgi:proteasome lid subunit RPN8/RPN11
MIDYCRQALPKEACGLISGPIGTKTGLTLWKLPNEAKKPNRFLLSERTIMEALEKMKQQGEQVTGIFHSHPTTDAYPSAIDVAYNPYPEIPYMIVSFVGPSPVVRCFNIKNNEVQSLELTLLRNE